VLYFTDIFDQKFMIISVLAKYPVKYVFFQFRRQ